MRGSAPDRGSEWNVEHVLGFIGFVLRQLAFVAVFFWPGWLVLNLLTLGRYPSVRKMKRDLDYMEAELIAVLGLLIIVGVVVLATRYWPG